MKQKPEICKGLDYKDCELAILRLAIDKSESILGQKITNSPDIIKIFSMVENFIKKKNLIAYGGIALNAMLPEKDKFYNLDIELPDYDFFSSNALHDAKELADDYANAGFLEVEAKPGVHHGTYKVYVNFIPVADITFLHKDIFNAIKKDSIRIAGILYAPPNFLRMSMYLELSRPEGDKSRWEKVLKRLILLNKYKPLTGKECNHVDFQRKLEKYKGKNKNDVNVITDTLKNTFIDQGVVFFGGYALLLYSKYMPPDLQKKISNVPDFDVLSEDPEVTAQIIKERLSDNGIKNVKIIKNDSIGEIVAPHYMINIGKDTVAFIYKPLACHSYNIISLNGQQIKVASIDTILSFYLAFVYSNRPYYDVNRLLCMAHYLFKVQQQNRLEQKGLLKRFSIQCYGHQQTIEEMRSEKAEKFKELKSKKDSPEYEEYFMRYRPIDKKLKTSFNSVETSKIKSISSKSYSSSKTKSGSKTKSTTYSSKSIKKPKRKTRKKKNSNNIFFN